MGHYFCRGNWNFFPASRNIAPGELFPAGGRYRPASLRVSGHPDSPIAAELSRSFLPVERNICPFAIRPIPPTRSRNNLPCREPELAQPLLQTIRNRYRSHYHFIVDTSASNGLRGSAGPPPALYP